MLTFLYFLILSFSLYLSFDIVPITNFERKAIKIGAKYSDTILSFSPNQLSYSSTYSIIARMITPTFYRFSLFLYDDLSTLNSDINKNDFSNYKKFDLIWGEDVDFEFTLENNNKKIYLFFENARGGEIRTINFIIYSDAISTTITNMITNEIYCRKSGISYYFDIPKNHKTYLIIGFKDGGNQAYGSLQIFEENVSKNKLSLGSYYEGYYLLKNGYSYSIKLTLYGNGYYRKYFYISQSNYFQVIFQVDINTEYYQQFPVLKETKLLLDLTTIEKNYKMLIEYDNDYAKENSIKAYGYNINDANHIQNNGGEELELIKDETCRKQNSYSKCKDYIRKTSSIYNYAILKISAIKSTYSDKYIFEIKYGNQEKYSPTTIYLSCGLGLIISIPNVILFILNKCIWKNDYVKFIYLLMDILFHLGFFNIISKVAYIGGNTSYIFGINFLILYAVLFFCYYFINYAKLTNMEPMYSGIVALIKKLQLNKTLDETINENRILPPSIKLNATASHEESREVMGIIGKYEYYEPVDLFWTSASGFPRSYHSEQFMGMVDHIDDEIYSEWERVDRGGGKLDDKIKNSKPEEYKRHEFKIEKREVETFNKEYEYKYNSWQDETNFILNKKYMILDVQFKYEIKFDSGASEEIEKMKSQSLKEAKSHDTDTELKEIFTVPNFQENVMCVPEKNCRKDFLYLILGIIMTFSGYSVFVHFFARYGKIEVNIIKIVSNINKYKNAYMAQGQNVNSYDSFNVEKNYYNDKKDIKLETLI